MILNLVKLTKTYGERVLFSDACLSVEKGEIIGLIGANGVGKTTLFNLITGKLAPDSGSVMLSSGMKLGYLEQHVCANSEKTAYLETVSIFSDLFEIEKEQKKISEELSKVDSLSEAQTENLILKQNELIE